MNISLHIERLILDGLSPIKHGYVTRVADWQYSSFHRFVKLGAYPGGWGGPGLRDMDLVGVE